MSNQVRVPVRHPETAGETGITAGEEEEKKEPASTQTP
jgi:hypothetical protein